MPEVRGTITCPHCGGDVRFVLMAMLPSLNGKNRATTYEAFHADANGCNVLWKCPNPRCFKQLVFGWRLLPSAPPAAAATTALFDYTQSTQNEENSVRLSPLPFQSTQSTIATVAKKTPPVDEAEQPTQIVMTQTQGMTQDQLAVQQAFSDLENELKKRNADYDDDDDEGHKKANTASWESFVNYYHHPHNTN